MHLILSNPICAQAPKSYTSSEILLQLKKLNTVGSVLYIAAHPDDENTRLIAYLANEKCVRTGYLSLTRGDGGQNLIGAEQGIELGMIRTQELLAARRTDGGEQFFTRAYDFGYSKTPEETFGKWNHDSVLADVVWVIRNFRPDIIITRFATDGSGGHGHHTASAILAEEAFDAAADPKRFPEQLNYVTVWQPRRMFHNSTARFFNPNADLSSLIRLDVGGYNPLLGKSYGEIAAESRSMHKSQGFGSARQRGDSFEYFKQVKGDTAGLRDIFQGIDFSWKRVQNGKQIESLILAAQKDFDPQHPQHSVKQLSAIKPLFKTSFNTMPYHQDLLDNLIANCSGTYQEVVAPDYYFAAGSPVKCYSYFLERLPGERTQAVSNMTTKDSMVLTPSKITQLYWLENKLEHNLYTVPEKTKLLYNNMALLPVMPNNTTNGPLTKSELFKAKPVQYKWVDPEKGELYRPVVITPPVMINVQSEVITFADNMPKEVKITARAGKDQVSGIFNIKIPSGWDVQLKDSSYINHAMEPDMRSIRITLNKKNEEKEIALWVKPLSGNASNILLRFSVEVDGVSYAKGIKEIKYDHIPVQTLFTDAEAKLIRLDVNRKTKHIGYIPGAGDEVQACLTQLGYEVTVITDDMLAKENLGRFDAIVTGVRAYNTNEKLSALKPRLMNYVANGGNLIVQYNTNSFAGPFKGDIGPYPFRINRDRVTDENASVFFELPDHPVLNTPNKITAKDFDGWIQERCIYSGGDADVAYEMPVSMSDPGEKSNKGSLLIAKHGKGHFIYTGLVFFRELPAGVPGAYRLFVNMIELGK